MNINKKRLVRFIKVKAKTRAHRLRVEIRRGYRIAKRQIRQFSFKAALVYIILQFRTRPRVRFISVFTLVLIIAFLATAHFASFMKQKEPEIKVNGQAVLVADKAEPKTAGEPEISQSVVAKDAPFIFANPVESGYLSQGYSAYHRAFDIATDLGTDVKPLGFGIVEHTGYTSDGKGLIVIVDHGEGVKSLYAHLGRVYVTQGEMVNPASAIGAVGMTGRSTGPHVHLEIYDGGAAVNPANLLPAEQIPLLYSR